MSYNQERKGKKPTTNWNTKVFTALKNSLPNIFSEFLRKPDYTITGRKTTLFGGGGDGGILYLLDIMFFTCITQEKSSWVEYTNPILWTLKIKKKENVKTERGGECSDTSICVEVRKDNLKSERTLLIFFSSQCL